MKNYELAPARPEELTVCMEILDSGRAFQRRQGFLQWGDGYPAASDVARDIESGCAYLLKVNSAPAAYLYIGFDGDTAYPAIEGSWHFEEPYGVLHRVAISEAFRGMGLSGVLFRLAGELVRSRGFNVIRIDTHEDNKRMQHVLTKNGFSYCGIVLQNGEPRLAYDKKL